jgi:prolyl oligopeptidase
MTIPRISLQATVGALVALTAVSATAQTRPTAPPVRNVTDTYFGVTVNDPYRYFEDLKNPEVAAWMKGEAAYTTSVLAKIPGRDELLKEIQVRGDAFRRISSVQVVGPRSITKSAWRPKKYHSLYA